MSFTYTTGIPASGNNPSVDQPNMQTNTNSISSLIAVDHVGFNQAGNGGKHNQVRMPRHVSIPSGLAANEGTLYTKAALSTIPSTESQLFYSPDASGNEYCLSRCITSGITLFGGYAAYGAPPATFTQNGGWTFLPGAAGGTGLIYNYGFYGKTGSTLTSGTIQFPQAFTAATTPFIVNVSLLNATGNATIAVISSTNTGFSFHCSLANQNGIYWTAIGI